jgi:hypothetical protein
MDPEQSVDEDSPFDRRDLTEIVVGACALAVPLAVTEEVWDLGKEIHLVNALLIVAVSYGVVAFFVREHFYQGNLEERGASGEAAPPEAGPDGRDEFSALLGPRGRNFGPTGLLRRPGPARGWPAGAFVSGT